MLSDELWSTKASWELRYCWFPRKCAISNQWLWLDMAYCGTLILTGPGDPIVEYRWHDAHEHLIWLIKS